jgi:hypothetical protein
MELHERPVEHVENKFLITEDIAYFLPYLNRSEAARFIEILQEIFDLNDPEIVKEVDGKLFGERIILGYYEPSTKEVVIHVPLETSEYIEKRIKEVFKDV